MADNIPDDNKENPEHTLLQGAIATNIGGLATNESVDKHNQSHSADNGADNPYKRLMMRISKPIRNLWNALEDAKNTNRVIAIATLAIAGSTVIYTYYAGKQWEAMNAMQAAQAAQLIVEKFSADGFPTDTGGTIVITNVGQTVANDINLGQRDSWVRTNKNNLLTEDAEKTIWKNMELIGPARTGVNLGPGKSLVIPFQGERSNGDIANFHVVVVGYRDIFKEPHAISECIILLPGDRNYHLFTPPPDAQ